VPAPKNEQAITVLLADSQSIYRVGIRKIFALEDDIRVVAQAENLSQAIAAAQKSAPQVVLMEASIEGSAQDAVMEILKRAPASRIVVVMDKAEQEDTVGLFRSGAHGIISRSISPDLLTRCVRKVAAGETWLDNRGVSWVLEAYRAQASQLTEPRSKAKLSDKEYQVISLVTQGLRNKDVAKEIGTSEQVIKNYLRKIYDKLGVADRLELALFCIHHGVLTSRRTASSPSPAAGDETSRAVSAG
jgi:DNA-binding NarL/FixJ family response regulator